MWVPGNGSKTWITKTVGSSGPNWPFTYNTHINNTYMYCILTVYIYYVSLITNVIYDFAQSTHRIDEGFGPRLGSRHWSSAFVAAAQNVEARFHNHLSKFTKLRGEERQVDRLTDSKAQRALFSFAFRVSDSKASWQTVSLQKLRRLLFLLSAPGRCRHSGSNLPCSRPDWFQGF